MEDRGRREARRVALATSIAASLAVAAFLLSGALAPVDLLFPGLKGDGAEVLVEDFGPDAVPDRYGYDGQETYVVARGMPDVAAASDHDIVEFRIRRILQPLLAWPAPRGDATALALVATNLVGIGLATWGLASIAARHGRDPRAGYAAAIALAFPLAITTTEPLAFGLGFAALALVDRGRLWGPVLLLGLAGLGRETALGMGLAAGAALVVAGDRRRGLAVGLVPIVPFAAWVVWLRRLVPATPYDTYRLLGIRDLLQLEPGDVVATVAVIALLAFGAWRWRDVPMVALTALAYLAACGVYLLDSFRVEAFVRLSAAGIAVGLAGLLPGPARVAGASPGPGYGVPP